MNLPAPTAFVGIASPVEQQYLSLFQSIGDNLRNRPYNWPQLKRGYTFTTVTSQTIYQLPGDFYRLLDAAQWDVTNKWPLRGPMSDFQMTSRQFVAISDVQKAYRILGSTQYLYSTSPYNQRSAGTFEIDPGGTNNTDSLFFGYMSCNWIWPIDWVANTVYVTGDIRSVNGYVYICKTGGTSSTITRPSTGTTGTDITDGSVVWRVYTEPYLCTPANAKLTDNDLCLFDEDLMIEGIRWMYRQSKGQDFQQLRTDWEDNVRSSFARFESPSRGNMCGDDFDDRLFPFSAPGSWPV